MHTPHKVKGDRCASSPFALVDQNEFRLEIRELPSLCVARSRRMPNEEGRIPIRMHGLVRLLDYIAIECRLNNNRTMRLCNVMCVVLLLSVSRCVCVCRCMNKSSIVVCVCFFLRFLYEPKSRGLIYPMRLWTWQKHFPLPLMKDAFINSGRTNGHGMPNTE